MDAYEEAAKAVCQRISDAIDLNERARMSMDLVRQDVAAILREKLGGEIVYAVIEPDLKSLGHAIFVHGRLNLAQDRYPNGLANGDLVIRQYEVREVKP